MKKICLLLYVCVLSIQSFAQNFPFEVCLDGINDNTKWYYVKINNKYIGVDNQLKLFVSDRVTEANVDKYLWAFIDAGKESFYLTNRFLGNSYRLGSNSSTSVIRYGDLAVMKQGTGRKMHYKFTKNGGAGIYTKNMFNTYLGTNNSLVGFVDSSNKADVIVDFAKSESEIIRGIEAEKNRKVEETKKKEEETKKKIEEQRKIREQKKIEEQKKNEEIAKRKSELRKRNGQWVGLTPDVEGYGYIKKIRVKTNIAAQNSSGSSVFFVTNFDNKATYLVLNTNSWIVYIDGDEYKKLKTLPKKGDWVEFDFQNLSQLYSLKSVDNSVPVDAIQFCEMNDNEIAVMNKKLKPYEVVRAEAKENESKKMMDELYKKYGKKYVDAADRGEIMVGMHEELVALVCMYHGSTLQMKYDNGQSKKYDIYAIRDVRTGYHQITEKSVWIGSVWIANHKVTSVTYGERWSK